MRSLVLLAAIAAFSTAGSVRAQEERPRFHVGAAVGESDLAWDWSQSGLPERFWSDESMEPDRVRKVVAGFRPVRIVGAEIEYVVFDDAGMGARGRRLFGGGQAPLVYDQTSYMKAGAEAWVLSALLFFPEPSPSVGFYAKIGVADLDESFTASATTVECVPVVQCLNTINSDVHRRDAGPYLGIGARFDVARAVAIRVEYEAIDRDVGDNVTMWSLGVGWER